MQLNMFHCSHFIYSNMIIITSLSYFRGDQNICLKWRMWDFVCICNPLDTVLCVCERELTFPGVVTSHNRYLVASLTLKQTQNPIPTLLSSLYYRYFKEVLGLLWEVFLQARTLSLKFSYNYYLALWVQYLYMLLFPVSGKSGSF